MESPSYTGSPSILGCGTLSYMTSFLSAFTCGLFMDNISPLIRIMSGTASILLSYNVYQQFKYEKRLLLSAHFNNELEWYNTHQPKYHQLHGRIIGGVMFGLLTGVFSLTPRC